MLFEFGGIFRKVWRVALILGTFVIGTSTLLVAPVSAATGINQQLNFQGRLLNAQGAVVTDGYYNVEFKIYQDGAGTAAGNPGGTLKWTEDWLNSGGNGVRVMNGYISVQLGSLNPFGNSVDWNQDTIWLSVNIGDTNVSCTPFASCSGDGEMLPMKRLSAVPYALNAAKLGGLTAAGFIQNTTTVQTATNMAIDGTARADTSILTPTIDTSTAVALNIGTTNAASINLNQNVTVAAGKSLTLAGGNTASRPGSPTEGTLYFDTTTKQLLVYSNGKWQADKNSSTKIVAASNASQALKDGADYVATGTSDQTTINSALTAAAGGKVYLTEGTFTTDDAIMIPNDTTLSGAGRGSLIKFANIDGQTKNMITNTDAATGKGATVRDLQLDGNNGVNTSGTMYGIYFNGMGGSSGVSARQGATITNSWVNNFYSAGIYLNNSPNSTINANNIQGNSGSGIYISSSNRSNITNNISQGNGGSGLVLSGAVSETITGNTFAVNNSSGVYLNGGSNNNLISSNNFYNNGGATANNAIYFPASANADYNTFTSNSINDTSGTTTNYVINILDNTSNNNYFSDNVFTSTAGTSAINDPAGSNTVYSNQSRAEAGAKLTNRTANDTEAFAVQNASGSNIFAVDTTNSQVAIGDATTVGKVSLSDGSSNTLTLGVGALAGDYTLTIPTITANDTVCLQTLANCGSGVSGVTTVGTLDGGTANADGAMISGTILYLQSASTTYAGLVNTATQTFAGAKTFNDSITLAAAKTINMTGSTTANRPASPTEGMVYYDTTTKQLLTYANGKWQADKSNAILVAASNSSDADKGAADYVATGTADQTPINNALTAADPASGTRKTGRVYLFAGTYTINGTISIPNNTTLAGAGAGTVITIPNGVNANLTAITNTTTGGSGTGVVVQDLKLDGNKANQSAGSYGMYGIMFNGMGSGTLPGGKIQNVWATNWYGNGVTSWTYAGIYISAGSRNTVNNVVAQGNTNNGIAITGTYTTLTGSDFAGNNYGIHLSSNNNTITGNTASGNTANGIYLENASQNTVTGNVATGNTTTNIYLSGSSSNTITGNQALGSASNDGIGLSSTSTYNMISSNIVQANSTGGISLASSSSSNTVTDNKIHNNGGNGNNKGIYLTNASSNTITDNTITDTAATTNNPISLDASSNNNYLSDNVFSSTPATGTIADSGTGTSYGSQSRAENGGQVTNRVANDTAAFTFQKADGTNVLTVDTTNDKVLIAGTLDTTTATTLSIGTSTATAISIGKAGITTTIAGNTGVTLNATTGTTMVCQNTTGLLSTCDATYLAPTATNFIQNQNSAQQATANFWISGTARADTSVTTPLLDTATAVALNIGTTNATAVNLNKSVTVAANQSLRLIGGNYASRPSSPSEGMLYYDTDSHEMLQWNGTKWVSNGSDAYLVAASNSSQADKDAADYVATGTSDQTTIQSALDRADPASAVSGARKSGKVYLFAGTYTTSDAISIPNNTTLAGAGRGSLIQFSNIAGQTKNMITNSDQTTGTGATVRDLRLDGNNSVNTSGTLRGISFTSMGGSSGAGARQGANIINNWVNNFFSEGIYLNNSPNSTIIGNNVQGGTGNGIYLSSSNRSNITNNISQGNSGNGLVLAGAVSENVVANTFAVNGTAGVYLNGSSNNNFVSSNSFYNNGGGTTNNAILFPTSANADYNTFTNNSINDTSGTTSNYAINISDNTSNYNYFADNMFTSTAGTSTINDPSGTSSVFSNQPFAENGGQITNRTINNSAAFTFQKADGTNILTVDTTNNKVLVAGTVDTTTATQLNIGSATANAISIGNGTITTTIVGYTGVTLNSTTGTTMVCRNATGLLSTCDATYLTPTATNFIQNGTALQASSNFHISGTGTADTSLLAPTVDTATGVALNIGTATATSVNIGKSAIATNLSSSTVNVGTSGATTSILGASQTTNNNAGNAMIIQGSTGLNGNGGTVTVQGGNANGTGTLGGNLTLAGGTGSASNGTVILATSTFQTATTDANCFPGGSERTTNSDCTIAQTSVNNNASVLVGFTNDALTAFMPDPSILTAGRVVYVTASNNTKDFTLSVNGGGQGNQIAMRKNTTATMIWNGADWTAAGASSSTTMQAAYDNTLQSAGGAELVVSKTSATNGLTIRDSSTNSVNGALLNIQSSSAANLFSVNSNVTEYTSNSGAETYSGTTTTFPASTWVALTGSTVTRNTTTANIATGQGSAQIATSTTAGSGIKNVLSSALTTGQHYNVSFSAKLSSGTFTDLGVYYSVDGSANTVTCTTDQAIKTSVWTKVNCTFTAPSSGITSANSINIRQIGSGTARTFYVDNISVTIAADYNYATDGDVDDVANFSTNWPYTTGIGTGSTTRNGSDGFNASSSAGVTITAGAANAGLRNKLSINPLASTLYRVSVYAKSSNAFNDFKIRYSPNGGTNYVDCVDYNTQVLTMSSWTQVTCYITTGATAVSNPYIYFVESTSSARTFYVDAFSMTLASSSTPNVQIGSGSNGGPTTLFTLDKGASAPIAANNDALLGSMYYDTTLGKLQCYEADGWGACGSSPDNIVTISPEYTNAVMHGTGVGTMTSDICSDALDINDGTSGQSTICGTNETYNFYKWTSPQATSQTYSIYVTYQLPATFKEFASGQTSVMGRTDSANSTVQYQIYRSNSSTGMTTCGSAVTVSTGVQTSWQPGQATGAADPSTCSFAAGDSIVFKISMTSNSNANAYIGNLGFTFSNR
jgi:parallel beta-helix repeat protein